MEQDVARRAFWALCRCPGRRQSELLSGSKCVVKQSEEKEEVTLGVRNRNLGVRQTWVWPCHSHICGEWYSLPTKPCFLYLSYGQSGTRLRGRAAQYDSDVLERH